MTTLQFNNERLASAIVSKNRMPRYKVVEYVRKVREVMTRLNMPMREKETIPTVFVVKDLGINGYNPALNTVAVDDDRWLETKLYHEITHSQQEDLPKIPGYYVDGKVDADIYLTTPYEQDAIIVQDVLSGNLTISSARGSIQIIGRYELVKSIMSRYYVARMLEEIIEGKLNVSTLDESI